MTEEPEPQEAPEEALGLDDGQSVEPTQVSQTPEIVDERAHRVDELERQNKDLQYKLTQRGRELAEQRRTAQAHPTPDEDIPAETFFTDPASATRKVVSNVLAEYENRQEQRRQAEEYLQSGAEIRGSTPGRLLTLHRQLQQASQDNPDEYLDILASIDKAQNTAVEIQKATRTAVNTAARNARAVTSEGGGTQVSPPSKSEDEMTPKELREHLVKKYGEEPLDGSFH